RSPCRHTKERPLSSSGVRRQVTASVASNRSRCRPCACPSNEGGTMFYDQAANDGRPFSLYRLTTSLATMLLLPHFIALAIAPMLLMLVPVAFVAIPFMIPAFFSGARSTRFEFQPVPVWRSAFAMQFEPAAHR